MPKVKIDYSNTIFYKIFCKDSSVKELYIGHTTNFVQRKYAHKQGCINPKSVNYNCKLYNVIRDNMGWDNWTMEIIAFHNCEDLMAAKKQEQQYFEEYKATLNSIEPLAPPKIKKEKKEKTIKEPLYCNTCNVTFMTTTLQERHNKTNKHIKRLNLQTTYNKMPKIAESFTCIECNFKCSKQSNWNKHILTAKHKSRMNTNIIMPKNAVSYECDCGKKYKHASSLWNHKQSCNNEHESIYNQTNDNTPDIEKISDTTLVVELVRQNKEFKQMLLDQTKLLMELASKSHVVNKT